MPQPTPNLSESLVEMHRKLDLLLDLHSKDQRARADTEATTQAILRALGEVGDLLGTVLIELHRIAQAVDKELPADNLGDLLRNLTRAVEGNTRATEALVVLHQASPSPPPAPPAGPAA